jgi:hypothetical protein
VRDQIEIANILAALGQEIMLPQYITPWADRYPNRRIDWIEGLKFFLGGYAFERQGRPPAYPLLAVQAIEEVVGTQKLNRPDTYFASNVWATFCRLGQYGAEPPHKGTNQNNNPIYPGKGRDVITLCASLEQHHYNIYQFALAGMQNDLGQVHRRLDDIRGIGQKIASLFLRDLALLVDSPIRNQDREFVEPIDIWLRRTAQILSGHADENDSDSAHAQAVIELADQAGCCALRLNAGSWYFGSQVAGTLRDLQTGIASAQALKTRLEERANKLEKEASALARILPATRRSNLNHA